MSKREFRFYSIVPLDLFFKDSDGGYVKVVNDFTQSAIINTLTGTRYDKAITLDALLQAHREQNNQYQNVTQQTAQDILKKWEDQGYNVDLESGTITFIRKKFFVFPYSKTYKLISYPYNNQLLRLVLINPNNQQGIESAIMSIANTIPSFALKEGNHERFKQNLNSPLIAKLVRKRIFECMEFAESGK